MREHRRTYRNSIAKACGHPDGCLKMALTKADGSLCSMHYNRLWRGSKLGPAEPVQSGLPSYVSAHQRVAKTKGKAAQYPCIDCSDAAADWSYDHSDPDELTRPVRLRGKPVTMSYSADVDRYEPRCRKCHAAFDKNNNEGDE